mmetsp:Transcript_9511/g.17344  ORF Transcript_9511/g.17344 Transcript_9511/m.17344 type:complete len:273 (-) Transcript_9511:12-830(-)
MAVIMAAVLMGMRRVGACCILAVLCVAMAVLVRGGVALIRIRCQVHITVLGLSPQKPGGVEGVYLHDLLNRHGVGSQRQAALHDGCKGVDGADGGRSLPEPVRAHGICLVQQDLVCEGHLLGRLVHHIHGPISAQLRQEMRSVDYREDAVDLAVLVHNFVRAEGLTNRPGVGHTSGFDQDSVNHGIREARFQPLFHSCHNVANGFYKVVPHGAAKAAVVEDGDGLHCGLLASTLFQQHLVDGRIAELIFNHSVPLPMLSTQDVVQQCGLSCP